MKEISTTLGIDACYEVSGYGSLASQFAVTDLATASLGAVGVSISMLIEALGMTQHRPVVNVNRRLASLWFSRSIYPIDWQLPPIWDAIAGDYKCRDGWIRLHTNLRHHRKAALQVLGCAAERQVVAATIENRTRGDLESKIVEAGGVAAAMRTRLEWASHPQGIAVSSQPLIAWGEKRSGKIRAWPASQESPLSGLRVLDLTRVLAGPVATRTLAGFGANVLRIDPVAWTEPNIVADITLGKRCCHLDLHDKRDRVKFEQLLHQADVLVHGYRPDALEQLGYAESVRRQIAPSLIEVSLNAYGWKGPWSGRRGFDSLVQMSCGIAEAGMHWAENDAPTPLPVQALDHATGYLMAAACIRAITTTAVDGGIVNAKLSLARTAELLCENPQNNTRLLGLIPRQSEYAASVENTPWGKAHRLKPPLVVDGTPMIWHRPACELGSSRPSWS